MTETTETTAKDSKSIFIGAILRILDETFDNVQGIYLDRNTSLFETLATVSADEASRPVSARCASISAQVAHVAFYLEMLTEFAQGRDPGKIDWGEIWRTVREVNDEEWSASLARLRTAYQQVIEVVKGIESVEDEDAVEGAMAMLVHTAYHLGEIRQALCTIKG
jgi:hypothetical protein